MVTKAKLAYVDMSKALAEYKELAEANGGHIAVERGTCPLDPRDEDDADLVRLFDEAGLPHEPEYERLLLRGFARQHYGSRSGRRKTLGEVEDYDLIANAYAASQRLTKRGCKVSIRSIGVDLAKQGAAKRAPAHYRDPRGNLRPKTVTNRLRAAILRWVANENLPHTHRNFLYLPDRFRELGFMVTYLKNLKVA